MAFSAVEKDYTGYLNIDGTEVPCTNFQLNMTMPLIKSAAVREPIYNGTFTAHGRMAIREYCIYDVSATFDTTSTAFSYIIDILKSSPRKGIDVTYTDTAYGITYTFTSSKTFLTGVSFSCNEGSLASMTVSFNVFSETIDVNYRGYSSGSSSHTPSWSSSDLLPYWMMNCTYTDVQENNIIAFDFNWTQSVEPMYSCCHDTNSSPTEPKKLKFGIPQINFSITYMHHDTVSRTTESIETPNTGTFVINKSNMPMITCDNCVTTSVSPQMGNGDAYVSYQVNGECLGEIA